MTLSPGSVSVLILAGRRTVGPPDAVAAAGGRSVKAFVEINGQSMLERVVRTLRQSLAIGEIHLCLPDEADLAEGGPGLASAIAAGPFARVAPASSPSASVRSFVAPRLDRQIVLVTTADHPLLTPAMVETFLEAFATSGAEVGVALADADRISSLYPQSRRTKLAFSDGRLTGCNLFAFRGDGAVRVLDFWRQVDRHRKQPWRIAHALGWGTLALYLCGRLALAGLFTRLSRRFDCRLQAVRLEDPHAGIDVDTPDDLRLVTEIIVRRESGAGRAG
ncbi:MAG: nucleotidyltransferase family protein [Opitutaceae bacterium]|nr:nucleotidyltransferase family protein [Opitutaceae bacterium]